MPAYVSPGVYVIEKDWSDYSPSLNATNVGIMGFASQGPLGKATLVTNADQLITTFGRPDDVTGGQGLIGAYHILDRTNTVYFTRVATSDAALADAAVEIGTAPHVQTGNTLDPASYHFFMVDVTDGDGASKTPNGPELVNVGQASSYFASATGADAVVTASDRVASTSSPFIFRKTAASAGDFVGTWAGSGASIKVWAWSSTAPFPTVPAGTLASQVQSFSGTAGNSGDAFSSTTGNMDLVGYDGWAAVAAAAGASGNGVTLSADATNGGAYVTRTLYPGAGYNYSSIIRSYGVKTAGLQSVVTSRRGSESDFALTVAGGAEESHLVELVSTPAGIDKDPEAVINNTSDETNKTSDYIIGEYAVDVSSRDDVLWNIPTTWGDALVANGTTSATVIDKAGASQTPALSGLKYSKLVAGTYNFTGGNNGDLSGKTFSDADVKAAVIGNAADGNGIYSYLKEDVDISILAIPGCTEQNIVNNAVSIAETSQEFLFVTNPPFGISTPQTAIAWSNGAAEGRTAALNSSYACAYWPWVKLFNPFLQIDEYVSPDIFAIRQMAFTDANFDAWFAPAGLVRGRLTKPVDVEVVLTQGDRDALYGPGNIINPVQKFLTEGIVLWGQRTTQRAATALDRINVRRLMIVIRKMLLASTRQFVFEPNDAATWKRVQNAVEPLMADIKSRRGVVDFKVICDSTTNTPIRIDRNELWCKVILQPTKAAEVIVFELNLTSATLGLDLPTA
jgi:phage tail sheath protein FI